MCVGEAMDQVQNVLIGGSVAYQNRRRSGLVSGGAVALDLLSLAALRLGFWRGRSAGRTEII
jgi:hypothetical protein